VRAIVSVLFLGFLAAAFAAPGPSPTVTPPSVSAPTAPVNLCTPPSDSTAGWQVIYLHGGMIKLPGGYAIASNAFNRKVFEQGTRQIVFETWMGLGGLNETAMKQISSCKLTLGGRPARITLLQSAVQNQFGAPVPDSLPVWWAVASWDVFPDGRSFDIYMIAKYPTDLMAMRAILWSAQFPGYDVADRVAQACTATTAPVADVSTVLDTGIVSMLAMQSSPPIGAGSAVFELNFDSTGALQPVEISETSLSDSTGRRVALVVGSNVRPQPPAAPRVAIRLSFTPGGVTYTAVATCARAP